MAMTKIQEKQNNELRLVSALREFQSLKPRAKQSGTNKYYKSKYSTLEDVIDVVNVATQFGLCFSQHQDNKDGKECIRTVIRHVNDTDILDSYTLIPCSDMSDAQKFGSGLTYAKRYGLQTLFGIPSEDDDGNGAVGKSDKKTIDPNEIGSDEPPKKQPIFK